MVPHPEGSRNGLFGCGRVADDAWETVGNADRAGLPPHCGRLAEPLPAGTYHASREHAVLRGRVGRGAVTGQVQAGIRSVLAAPIEVGGRAEVRWAASRIIVVFLAARLLVLACAIGVETFAPPDPNGPGGSVLQATDVPVLSSLTSWDAVYYIDIAGDGYQAGPVNGPYPDDVFFPLYPVTIRMGAVVVGNDLPLAGVLVANLAGLGALVVVYALMRRRLAPGPSMLATTLVALQPGAVAFSMAYSDSLFLLLVCGSLLAAECRSRPLAGLLAGLAALTRLQGVLLLVPLLILFAQQDGRRPRRSWLWSLGAPIGLGIFCVAIGRVTGDLLTPIRAQAAWDFGEVPGAVAEPWVIVVAALIYGATALAEVKLLYDRWRTRHDTAGMSWALLNFGAIAAARRVQSLPRYLAPVTQVPEQLAGGAYRPVVVRTILAVAVASYVVLAILAFRLLLAP